MTAAAILLLLVMAQRLGELVIAARHTKRLLAEGAYEVGADHYKWIVAVHMGWLGALVFWTWINGPQLSLPWLVVYIALQAARVWTMMSLGRFWTTRIIVVPNAPLVRRGPYRFFKHPNYVVVVLEIAALPLVLGAWPVAVIFSVLNALVLRVRIKAEAATFQGRAV
jgi:methyltransferase